MIHTPGEVEKLFHARKSVKRRIWPLFMCQGELPSGKKDITRYIEVQLTWKNRDTKLRFASQT